MALLFRRVLFRGEAVPFVMELPNYRLPGLKNVGLLLWEKASDFLRRAFTVIFLATLAIWFLQSYDLRLNYLAAEGANADSILARIAGFIAPVFKPLGFGSWQASVALITGFIAKESVVSTFTVLLGAASVTTILSPLAALPFLVFCLLYTPCVAAIGAIRRELGVRWAARVVLLQCAVAWIVAALVRLIVLLFGGVL